MSAMDPLSVHRRIERQWAERVKSLKTIQGRIVNLLFDLSHRIEHTLSPTNGTKAEQPVLFRFTMEDTMKSKYIAIALLSTALMTGVASAQTPYNGHN
jgi:hypothetical protein